MIRQKHTFASITVRNIQVFSIGILAIASTLSGQDMAEYRGKRCEIVPEASHEVSFRINGIEKLRWHSGLDYPRPFFYPLNGPVGATLTRMGHPGAPNHEHHQSVWFAHHDIGGLDFWSNTTENSIRQIDWLAYEDGDDEAIMAVQLGWFNGQGEECLRQQLVAALLPVGTNEHALELQIRLEPGAAKPNLMLGRTNFGFLAVRVAKSLSAHFGGGQLSNSEGQEDEKNLFGQPARWVDYSGPIVLGNGANRATVVEGITYFDHPSNPRYPTRWHVRRDGWMGASFCFEDGLEISKNAPLVLRYLLYAHNDPYNSNHAAEVHHQFANRPGFEVVKAKAHRQFRARRVSESVSLAPQK